jgi:hypothetical protein
MTSQDQKISAKGVQEGSREYRRDYRPPEKRILLPNEDVGAPRSAERVDFERSRSR